LPAGLSALVHLDKIEVLPIFKVIKDVGVVPEEDMINNLNMGVGMTMVTSPREETAMLKYLGTKGIHAYNIGKIIEDADNAVKFSGKINWEK
jgi:phosphoribosylformylglycinamidine cyclo-ligase